ncbi:hypothetical protein L2725_21350 [Shewanella corallii]|uniref:Lipoprotein n=1 Tax=Shewanella corallii TaxID=560080 RepID=A0ABT0NDU2_9GAMM|nr:hypothetical protein [Shewanella corallii]MCL2916285.1 hypothetical protein [Shewanella corallii]
MKKYIAVCILAATLSSGCMSTSENAATMDRAAAATDLISRMDEVGYAKVAHVPGVDQLLHSASSILERQRSVIEMYQAQSTNHRDVQAFLYANKDLEPLALEQAIVEFDAGALNDEEKIGPKIQVYRAASEQIFEENVELAVELTVQLGISAAILAQNGEAVTDAISIKAADYGVNMLTSSIFGSDDQADEDKETEHTHMGLALLAAKDRLELAYEANELIDLELDTIKAVEALQLELEARR